LIFVALVAKLFVRKNRTGEQVVKLMMRALLLVMLGGVSGLAAASDNSDTIARFKAAGRSASFFGHSYGYAVFPTVGEGGLVVGGAHGSGAVYAHGKRIASTSLTQLSVGFQAGGKAYSEIIFFEDKRAFDEFASGKFEFGADAGVVAITAGASAKAGTTGDEAGASGGQNDARTAGEYRNGMAVFTIAKGGLMFDVSVAGQKFTYQPLGS
jgi:lipid-binding SYLF domain-containing protein